MMGPIVNHPSQVTLRGATEFLGTFARAISPPRPRGIDPAEALMDLRLLPDIRDLLVGPLTEYGFKIEDAETDPTETGDRRQYSLLKNPRGQRKILYVPWEILDDPSNPNVAAFFYIMNAFQESTVYLISDLEHGPHGAYRSIMEGWQKVGVVAKYLEWRDWQDLHTLVDIRLKIARLKRLFALDDGILSAGAVKCALLEMTGSRAREIAEALSTVPGFNEARGRQQIVTAAGLGEVFSKINFEGAPRLVAWSMVNLMQELPAAESDRALGQLLGYLATWTDLRQDLAVSFNAVITEYRLDAPRT